MARNQMLEDMASVRLGVTHRVRETIQQILDIAESYRFLGKNFTFSYNEDLDTQVNRMLVALSDGIKDDNDKRVLSALSYALDEADIEESQMSGDSEERRDALFAYVDRKQGDETRQERYDMYCTRLRNILEGWIAAEFAYKVSKGSMMMQIFSNFGNPAMSELWQQAAKEGGFAAGMLAGEGTGYGKGVSRNILDGLSLTSQTAINEAYQYGILLAYGEMGNVVGYRVHRGSTYDCPHCDELCIGIHPLTEMVLPAHPRCCCYTTPVLRGHEDD